MKTFWKETLMTTALVFAIVLLGGTDREHEGLGLIQHGWALYNDWAVKGRPAKSSNCL